MVNEDFLQMLVPLGELFEWKTKEGVELEGEPSPLHFYCCRQIKSFKEGFKVLECAIFRRYWQPQEDTIGGSS